MIFPLMAGNIECHQAFSDMGIICCKDGIQVEKETGYFIGYDPVECPCPNNGVLTNLGHGLEVCCKDNYLHNEETGKYDIVFGNCGCPNGGKSVSTRDEVDETRICCKDGKELNNTTKKYDLINGWCGCPDGGKQIAKTYGCYKDGKAYSFVTGKYDAPLEYCPLGGKSSPIDPSICCKNGLEFVSVMYGFRMDKINPKYCGCPDGYLNVNNETCCDLYGQDFWILDRNNWTYEDYYKDNPVCLAKTGWVDYYYNNQVHARFFYKQGKITDIECYLADDDDDNNAITRNDKKTPAACGVKEELHWCLEKLISQNSKLSETEREFVKKKIELIK